ncbi:MAG TPA: transcription termination factor Rho [Patescibacteria group bacterium]|nr:transcription termination factor Rho [Patescibacteria group bacterium]
MAFRATHTTTAKTSRKKVATADVVPDDEKTEPIAPAMSVEELVGSPILSKEPVKSERAVEAPKTPEEAPIVEPPVAVSDPQQPTGETSRFSRPPMARMDRPRVGYDRGGGGYQQRGYQGGGGYRRPFNPSRFGGEAGHNPRFQGRSNFGDNNNNGGYRRDWGGAGETNTYTQDINVPTETVHGILDIMPEGHGFLRPKFTPSDRDVYISQSQIRRFMLRNGDMVEGQARQPKDNERYWGLLKVEKVNEQLAETMGNRPHFEDLTPVYPNTILRLETGLSPISTRMIDLVAPIGFGQRGLIVSPPKAGKTTILKEIAAGISANYPNVHLMAALIGERPEEVTDLTRSIKGEVLASNFDESPPEQTRVAEVALDRAKRLVEMGQDVVVLLDSITRLARAYNLVVNPSGRTLSGGFDPAALYPAKKFLGAARCVEPVPQAVVAVPATPPAQKDEKKDDESAKSKKGAEESNVVVNQSKSITGGGSLTVIGTALVETGSRMDDLIYEEFKGTGNMELHLSRALQERRVFPAIDVGKSGTRHDELLMGEDKMKKVTTLRHMLSLLGDEERTMMLVEKLSKTKNNDEFLESLSKGD